MWIILIGSFCFYNLVLLFNMPEKENIAPTNVAEKVENKKVEEPKQVEQKKETKKQSSNNAHKRSFKSKFNLFIAISVLLFFIAMYITLYVRESQLLAKYKKGISSGSESVPNTEPPVTTTQ